MNIKFKYKYDTFNARYLSFEEVAKSFITNNVFEQLIANNNTLLMGPRGCGKTTLLKMLTPKAIHHYNERKPSSEKIFFPFIGIYIPADIQWEKQLSNFSKRFIDTPEFSQKISRGLVNTHILISLVNTFYDLVKQNSLEEKINLIKEYEVCDLLAEYLKLKKPISLTFYSIIIALKSRVIEINTIINKIDGGQETISDLKFDDYFFEEIFPTVSVCCDAFKKVYEDDQVLKNQPSRWALCFDELEIAPKWLQKELIVYSLRNEEQNFLLKLTTTPLIDSDNLFDLHKSTEKPSQNEDYKVIRNWVFNQESSRSWEIFCKALFVSLLYREFNVKTDLEKIFGKTTSNLNIATAPLNFISNKNAKPYYEGSVEWIIFKTLAEKDASFYKFLDKKQITPFNPVPPSKDSEDSIFRKIKPIVYSRHYFRRVGGLRSRKVNDLYSGIPLLFEICDGNPRTLLNLFESILPKLKKDQKGRINSINLSEQSRIIKNVSELKLESIKNNPSSNMALEDGKRIGLGEILDKIGKFFFESLVINEFNMDPIGSFFIDKNIDDRIVGLLKIGLNLGAIQYINPKQDITDEDIYNKQYRLSFSLYPHYNLPIREYSVINLSKILPEYLKDKGRIKNKPKSIRPDFPKLFDYDE